MRILKEYSALSQNAVLSEQNSVELLLLPEKSDAALKYILDTTDATAISHKTLEPLKVAVQDVFGILAENAGVGETVKIACSYHKYYYMVVFEFSEAALPLHTLNKSVKVLGFEKGKREDEIGFMNAVHLVNRISLSVDKITEKMRITIIKEKNYSRPKLKDGIEQLSLPPFELCGYGDSSDLAANFSEKIYCQFGDSADKFLITPELFIDNLEACELSAIFLRDKSGLCAGGAVWHETHGIIVLMIFSIFVEGSNIISAKNLLLDGFKAAVSSSSAGFIVAKKIHSERLADYFDSCDDMYRYKPTGVEIRQRQTSYIKPDLMPLIKKAYKNFEVTRNIHEVNYIHRFYEPYSVISAVIDTQGSEALLSVLWFGDDLKANIIRHVIALNKIGIEKIYFRLDLGSPEEAAVSGLISSCGFEAQYLWPYSGDKGDIVVFTYSENMVYELKPCKISPINKDNINKTPQLVTKVYDNKYPSQYLYEPQMLWDKIRKRQIYPFIAIDDDQNAVGMISFIKLESNPYLFEIGQLMVDPSHRGTNIASQLIEYIHDSAIQNLDFDAVLSESVTNHKFSQRSCISSGFCDTALKLNIMSGTAFALEEQRRRIVRMSCVVSCIERADETFTVYLPKIYAKQIKYCFLGLKPRKYEDALTDDAPEEGGITEYHIDEGETAVSKLLNITIFKIGSDIESAIERCEKFAVSKEIKCLLINIPLSDPHNYAAVNALKTRSFFFGGVIPYWLPESDALLMQKLYDNEPDWDSIKLFSKKIKEIAIMIRNEIKS
ncbi:MAG: GNAT family N-acetyltransferase [Eubacterium sp.]|jgi:GNAT superfamily N-acetyltransferase|nr:GNAT family N-acetyltransferase [Eubacterium sp.]